MTNLDPKKTIFIIDGSSFLYRAYYGLRPLHTNKGVPVQAVYSFCRMIKRLVTKFDAKYITLVWDSKGKTTRHEMFAEYKATRQAPPSDIFDQKELILKFADSIGIKNVAKQGIEADDIMFSITQDLKNSGIKSVLATSDKDMGQTLTENIVLFDAFKDKITDKPTFEEKMGFEVAKLPFYFALLGDSSDNIPGVKGIGKKGATDLVTQFESLEDLYNRLDEVKKPRTRSALEQYKESAFLSLKLFLLQYHKTDLTLKDFVFDKNNWANAQPLFEELNFKSLLKELEQEFGKNGSTKKEPKSLDIYNFKTVNTIEKLNHVCEEIKKYKTFALDTETDGLQPLECNLIGISICVQEGEAYYIPLKHKTGEEQIDRNSVLEKLKPIFEDEQYKKYLHNAKFDQLVLHSHGINLKGVSFDSFIAAKLLLKEWQSAGLKQLSLHYFNEEMLNFDEVVVKNNYPDFSHVPLDIATRYAAADAHQTFKLTRSLLKELKEADTLLYQKIDHPLCQLLFEMEAEGIKFDPTILKNLNEKVTQEINTVAQQIHALLGTISGSINFNSPKQVEQLLFGQLGLPPQRKSLKGKGYSTNQEVLSKLAKMHPVPKLIMKHRELYKLKSTYIDALPNYINPKTGKIHTTFSQTSTATGRLSSFNPNLQNIPADSSGYGIEIRSAFKPKEKHLFLSADYSQIELRVMAYLSQDQTLMNAFLNNLDIHTQTASQLFDTPQDHISHEQRQIGKRINFSVLYGLTPYGLSRELDIPLKDAKYYIDKYFEQYSTVSTWMEETIEKVKDVGFVETKWGRRRNIPGIYEKNRHLYEEARRIAINTRVQGTAAEIMKIGMIKLNKAIKNENLDAKIILQIHDELILSTATNQAEKSKKLTQSILEGIVNWNIPLIINLRVGKNWKEVSK